MYLVQKKVYQSHSEPSGAYKGNLDPASTRVVKILSAERSFLRRLYGFHQGEQILSPPRLPFKNKGGDLRGEG